MLWCKKGKLLSKKMSCLSPVPSPKGVVISFPFSGVKPFPVVSNQHSLISPNQKVDVVFSKRETPT